MNGILMRIALMVIPLILTLNDLHAIDLAKELRREVESAFSYSPLEVSGWIKNPDGSKERIEVQWTTSDAKVIAELHDLVSKMELTDYSEMVATGRSAGLNLALTFGGDGKGNEGIKKSIFLTFSTIRVGSITASHDPSKAHFDSLASLLCRRMKARVVD